MSEVRTSVGRTCDGQVTRNEAQNGNLVSERGTVEKEKAMVEKGILEIAIIWKKIVIRIRLG